MRPSTRTRSGLLASVCLGLGATAVRAATVRFNPQASIVPGINALIDLPTFQRITTTDLGAVPADVAIPQSLGPLVSHEEKGPAAAAAAREDVVQSAMAAITQAATLSAADQEEQLAGAAALLKKIELLHESWLNDTAIDPLQPDLPKEVRDLIEPKAVRIGDPVPIMDLVAAAKDAARRKLTEKLGLAAERRIAERARALGGWGAPGQLPEGQSVAAGAPGAPAHMAGLQRFDRLTEDSLYVSPPAGAGDPILLGGRRTPNWTAIPDEQGIITLAQAEARLYMRRENSGWRVWDNVGGAHQILPVGESLLIGRGDYMGGYAFNGNKVSRVALMVTALPDRVLLWDQASLRGFNVSREGSNIVSVPPPLVGAPRITLQKTAGGLLQRTIIHGAEHVQVKIGDQMLIFYRKDGGLYLNAADFQANRPVIAGRNPQADLVVDSIHASRQHTRVLWVVDPVTGQHFFEVLDLGSMNGTGVSVHNGY